MKAPGILDILVEKIKKDYLNDISIVYVYGSYLDNEYHSLSDIDLFIVRKTDKGKNLGLTFILNGIGYDFWTVSWEWVERVANYDNRNPSLITEGKVIYYGSEDDLTRYNNLKEKAHLIDKEKYLEKAIENMKAVYKTAFQINNSDSLSEIRNYVIGFVYEISEILSQVNYKNIKHIRKHFKSELKEMKNIPDNFEENYEILFISNNLSEIKKSVNYLTVEINKIIEKYSNTNELLPFKDVFSGWYEEMIQHYNKIYHACDICDYQNALFASVELAHGFDTNFKKIGISPNLPNMVEAYNPKNLNELKKVVIEHQKQFEQMLAKNCVEILIFNNVEEFRIYYEKI